MFSVQVLAGSNNSEAAYLRMLERRYHELQSTLVQTVDWLELAETAAVELRRQRYQLAELAAAYQQRLVWAGQCVDGDVALLATVLDEVDGERCGSACDCDDAA